MTRALQIIAACALFLLSPDIGFAQGSAATRPIDAEERAALFPSREMLSLGENVANTACARCHGADGIGIEPGIPHLAGQRTVYLFRELQAYQSRDRRNDDMVHAAGFLNHEALLAVSAWYASLVPARSAPADDSSTVMVETSVGDAFPGIRDDMKKCVKCHGADGNASASGMPNLTAQPVEYFAASMQAYADGKRDHKVMAKLATGLDAEVLNRMGVFYAVQEPVRTSTAGGGDSAAGQSISEPCANCHGPDGNASGADMPTLAGQDARYFVKAMRAYQTGKRQHKKMFVAVELLNEKDLENLAAFYANQEPVRRNVRTPLTSGEWIERCERCHGLDGNPSDPRFPMLAGQDSKYLAHALQAYVSSTRSSTTMHAMAAPLSVSDVANIVQYFSTREPKSVIYMQLPCEEPQDP
jgi:cytochrome c553